MIITIGDVGVQSPATHCMIRYNMVQSLVIEGLDKPIMYEKHFGTDSNGLVIPYVSEIEGTDWV